MFWQGLWIKGKFEEFEGNITELKAWFLEKLNECQIGIERYKLTKTDVKEVMKTIKGSKIGMVFRSWRTGKSGVEVGAIEAVWMDDRAIARIGRVRTKWLRIRKMKETEFIKDEQLDEEDVARITWMIDRDKYWAQTLEKYRWLKEYDIEYDDYIACVHEGWKVVQVLNGEESYLVSRNLGRMRCKRLLSVIANVGFLSRISYEQAEKLKEEEVEDAILKGIWG